jgi:hypothetical protein
MPADASDTTGGFMRSFRLFSRLCFALLSINVFVACGRQVRHGDYLIYDPVDFSAEPQLVSGPKAFLREKDIGDWTVRIYQTCRIAPGALAEFVLDFEPKRIPKTQPGHVVLGLAHPGKGSPAIFSLAHRDASPDSISWVARARVPETWDAKEGIYLWLAREADASGKAWVEWIPLSSKAEYNEPGGKLLGLDIFLRSSAK